MAVQRGRDQGCRSPGEGAMPRGTDWREDADADEEMGNEGDWARSHQEPDAARSRGRGEGRETRARGRRGAARGGRAGLSQAQGVRGPLCEGPDAHRYGFSREYGNRSPLYTKTRNVFENK